jgi:hypothetical protein
MGELRDSWSELCLRSMCARAMNGVVFLVLRAVRTRPGFETGSTRQSRIPPHRLDIDSSRRNSTCTRRVDIRRDTQFRRRPEKWLLEAMDSASPLPCFSTCNRRQTSHSRDNSKSKTIEPRQRADR